MEKEFDKMRELAFFHRSGGSGRIRGKQVAKYLGAKLNPKNGYEDDVCIYVKMQPPEDFPKHSYLDIVDGDKRLSWLMKHPDIGVIACSQTEQEYLSKKLKRKDIVFIPQHHCNYERIRRQRKGITVAGVIGKPTAVQCPVSELRSKLAKIRVDFKMETKYPTRQHPIDFYKQIDVQVFWRPLHRWFKNPLKLVNAGSFGIPTVAFPEIGYKEVSGYYMPANSVDELIAGVLLLKESEILYKHYTEKLIEKTEEYHINNVAKLYTNLLRGKNG